MNDVTWYGKMTKHDVKYPVINIGVQVLVNWNNLWENAKILMIKSTVSSNFLTSRS